MNAVFGADLNDTFHVWPAGFTEFLGATGEEFFKT